MRRKSASVSGQGIAAVVSVGGVIFENECGFEGMYRAAEQQLLNAENSGDVTILRIASDLSATSDNHSHH